MHVHLPKPLHGWREFLGEVGIIVIGVLIALGAEQVVENIHWAERVRDAKEAMTQELGYDDGAQAEARLAIAPCLNAMLDGLEQKLVAERDKGTAFQPNPVAAPPFRTWDRDAWNAAAASGTTSHMAAQAMYDWTSPYALMPDMDQASVREYQDWAPLLHIATVPAHPSEAERARLLGAIASARRDNDFLAELATVYLRYIKRIGVTVPDDRRHAEARREAANLPGCRVPNG